MAKVSALTPGANWGEIALILTDHAGMVEINEACTGKQQSTDVLSLSYDSVPGESTCVNVELVINIQRYRDGTTDTPSPQDTRSLGRVPRVRLVCRAWM